MWWKIASILLLAGVFLAGLLVPLYPGLQVDNPAVLVPGNTEAIELRGYNTFFTQSTDSTRVWLTFKNKYALQATQVSATDNVTLLATFAVPAELPVTDNSMSLDVLVDDPLHGAMGLSSVARIQPKAPLQTANDSAWRVAEVRGLHKNTAFRYTILPNNYESIRNLFFHVPMWMVMMVMFLLSVWHSVRYLRKPLQLADARAQMYAEVGLLFGLLGLVTGMLWANYTWGAPWSNDIKQLMTVAALLIYVSYFILRSSFDEPEKGARIAAVYNIFAFATLIPLIYIVPRIFSSLHPGGEGNPVFNREDLNVNMRVVFYPAVLGWTLLALWVAQLRIRFKVLENRLMDR